MTAVHAGAALDATAEVVADLGREADRRWAELDEGRRLPDDLCEAALRAGLFRTLVPRNMGGTGATPVEWFRIGVELARHEPSLGWVVTQGAAELGWIAAGADPAWAAEVLADPVGSSASTIAGIGELAVDGTSARVRGRWAFDTGCTAATWIGGLCLLKGAATPEGLPELRFAWVPAARAEILGDWDPAGMRGTGSHSIVIPEQAIETAWTFNPMAPTTNDRGPHRCVVGNGNWPIAGSVAATQLGAARRAIDEATLLASTKAPAPDFVPLAESPTVQRALIDAEGLWQACVASAEHELAAMWEAATRDGALSTDQRVRLFAAHATANVQALRIIDAMCGIAGSVDADRAHPLSRCRRDAQMLHAHRATGGRVREEAAKVKLGLLAASPWI